METIELQIQGMVKMESRSPTQKTYARDYGVPNRGDLCNNKFPVQVKYPGVSGFF